MVMVVEVIEADNRRVYCEFAFTPQVWAVLKEQHLGAYDRIGECTLFIMTLVKKEGKKVNK